MNLTDWFLTAAERGNAHTDIPAWCEGSLAEPLVHGRTYFDRLAREVEACGPGDYVFFTDWRGDPDQLVLANVRRSVYTRTRVRIAGDR